MPENIGFQVAFWVLAVISVGAALAVVLLRDVFRAALFLVLYFFIVAGLFVTLNADFLAAAQVLIYVGAVSVLLIFAIMLTREAQRGSPSNRLRIPAFIVSLLLLGALVSSILSRQNWAQVSQVSENARLPLEGLKGTTGALANLLFGEGGFLLPFEIAAVLLLAAVIGAIVMMREK